MHCTDIHGFDLAKGAGVCRVIWASLLKAATLASMGLFSRTEHRTHRLPLPTPPRETLKLCDLICIAQVSGDGVSILRSQERCITAECCRALPPPSSGFQARFPVTLTGHWFAQTSKSSLAISKILSLKKYENFSFIRISYCYFPSIR